MTGWPKAYAWTPGQNDRQNPYKLYPQYLNVSLNADGSCHIRIRAHERYVGGEEFLRMGETAGMYLPPATAAELRTFFASGTEAGTGETEGLDTKCDGPTSEAGGAQS